MVDLLKHLPPAAAPGDIRAGEEKTTARRYAGQLLAALGAAPGPLPLVDEHPALAWSRSGLMGLTGNAGGAPLMCPAPLAACADGALAALASLAPAGAFEGWRGSDLLAERAALTGHTRRGAVSPGGSCRLLRCCDGMLALNLAREDDWALLPAWLEADCEPHWDAVAVAIRERSVQTLEARGRELGLALAASAKPSAPAKSVAVRGRIKAARPAKAPRVLELASLWAGPLCGRLLQRCGAEVIKIESRSRPDGARAGHAGFFARMNEAKTQRTLDFAAGGREELLALIRTADIVIEGSRPRALRQLGIDAKALCAERPQLTWISITGHGHGMPQENWVAYGDDAAVAAGLSALMKEVSGQDVFCGDAIADPLTGLHAALAAWSGWLADGGGLVSASLRETVAQCLHFELPLDPAALQQRQERWQRMAAAP